MPRNYYISFTGKSYASSSELASYLQVIQDSFRERGDTTESSIQRARPEAVEGTELASPQAFAECMKEEFSALNPVQAVLYLAHRADLGTGQILELGYAKAKNIPVILAKNASVGEHWLDTLTDYQFEYGNAGELGARILELPLED